MSDEPHLPAKAAPKADEPITSEDWQKREDGRRRAWAEAEEVVRNVRDAEAAKARIPLAGPIELDMLLRCDPRNLRIVRKPKPDRG